MTVIASNVSAIRAQNASNTANQGLSQAMERLSTGKRINTAKDDAAGLAIATKMTAEVRGLSAARRNANDGLSLTQTAEGALGDISNMLVRMKELSVQSANGTNDASARTNLQLEVTALIAQIDEVAGQEFNGVALFGGTTNIQVGTASGDTVAVTTTATDSTTLAIAAVDISTEAGAGTAMGLLDTAIGTVASARAAMGATQSRLESAASNLTTTITNLTDARSRIEDADFAEESTSLAKNQILSQASTAMLAQANQSQQGVLSLLR
ncbi:MAG: flagellin FliC [Alphaproteobacteria bacterium]|jgi:Flagellin and related hook-associated proteins|nr:flagellin FliC [Alphaproteobacteria bacterium]MBU0795185.1 flagellin FliC [Alphaproteobacteria bacterium]MBU0874932.1 flagellin FliC [Alphaproteobacteria bacterium]MBU1769531.1 flagellin FliC [Alphaproteobacteria bacterium]